MAIAAQLLGTVLHVDFDRTVRDLDWSSSAGRIRVPATPAASVVLDFSATVWADPFALLSLCCMMEGTRTIGQISVELGTVRRNSQDNKFLLFVAEHGFLGAFGRFASIRWEGKTFSKDNVAELVSRLRKLNTTPTFQSSECISATIFDLATLKRSNRTILVERLVQEAYENRINRWLTDNARQRGFLLHKLRVILTETLDNVSEHAYSSTNGVAGIFARIRLGTPEESLDFRSWTAALSDERTHCPTLNRANYGKRPGWLELFVCDSGMGLTAGLTADQKSPLLTLSNKLFKEPVSKHANRGSLGKTVVTGLQHMGFVLSARARGDRGDFVRVYSSGEWVGEHLPWPADRQQAAHANYRNSVGYAPPPGTAYHFALEPGPADISRQLALYPNFFFVPQREDLAEVRSALASVERTLFAPSHDFIDLYVGQYSKSASRGVQLQRWIQRLTSDTVIVRPARSVRKADLMDQLAQLSQAPIQIRNLIFADVPWSLAIDIGHILNGERLQRARPSWSIFVVSQDWSCAAFTTDGRRTFKSSRDKAAEFLHASSGVGAYLIASLLRERDSQIFWHGVSDAYLNEMVVWHRGDDESASRNIRGYLDLPYALTSPTRGDAARRSLRRAITSFAHYCTVTADELARPLVDNDFQVLNGDLILSESSTVSAVVVGSVMMTGSTLARFLHRPDLEAIGKVHLLQHPEGRSATTDPDSLTAILWSPPRGPLRTPKVPYERIRHTPFIVRGGERAIPLPRFRSPTKGRLGESLYGDNPNSAYARWQKLGLLRMGHWTYNFHHDLLTVKLGDALEFDFIDGGRIVPWMMGQLRQWQAEFRETKKDIVVVYPRHAVMDTLVRLLNEHIQAESQPPVIFFPLQLVRGSSVSPIMVSPIERDRLGQHLVKFMSKGGLAVLIDDGLVSGRTTNQLSQFLRGLWAALRSINAVRSGELEVRSMALLDRTGVPTQRAVVEQEIVRHPRLWRWDVPPLGQEGSCRLCGVLVRCREIKSSLSMPELSARVSHWIETWRAVPVDDHSPLRGLPPRILDGEHATRFCIERLDNGKELAHEVHHFTSTSRAALAAEICRSTTRREFPLNQARNGRDKSGRELDVQTKIEILGTQILLFQEELTFIEKGERLSLMMELLWDAPETSAGTSLAALTTLVDPSAAELLWTHCENLIEEKGFPNDDSLIVAFALHSWVRPRVAPKSRRKEWSLLQLLVASRSAPRGSLARIFQVFGWDENSIHRGLLLDLLKKPAPVASDVYHVVLMIEALASALEKIEPESVAALGIEPHDDASSLRTFLIELRDFAKTCIPTEVDDQSDGMTIKLAVAFADDERKRQLIHRLRMLYGRLFIGPESTQSRYKSALSVLVSAATPLDYLEPIIRAFDDEWDKVLHYRGDSTLQARWGAERPLVLVASQKWEGKATNIYHDALVRRALIELVSNVMHRSEPIQCPWPDCVLDQTADMWASLQPSTDGSSLVLQLANGAVAAGSNIERTANIAYLRAIGGTVQSSFDPSASIFYTRVTLPSLASLAWEGVQ